MANANYYGSLFKSNGTASAAPTEFYGALQQCPGPGFQQSASGSITFTAALATTDKLYLARVPAGHRVKSLRFRFAEIDSGTTVTVNVGVEADGTTYDDADAFLAASTLFRAAAMREFPAAGTTPTADAPTTWWTGPAAAGVPNVEYNVVLALAAGPSTATSGTIYYEVDYVLDQAVLNENDGPVAVQGTQ